MVFCMFLYVYHEGTQIPPLATCDRRRPANIGWHGDTAPSAHRRSGNSAAKGSHIEYPQEPERNWQIRNKCA